MERSVEDETVIVDEESLKAVPEEFVIMDVEAVGDEEVTLEELDHTEDEAALEDKEDDTAKELLSTDVETEATRVDDAADERLEDVRRAEEDDTAALDDLKDAGISVT